MSLNDIRQTIKLGVGINLGLCLISLLLIAVVLIGHISKHLPIDLFWCIHIIAAIIGFVFGIGAICSILGRKHRVTDNEKSAIGFISSLVGIQCLLLFLHYIF